MTILRIAAFIFAALFTGSVAQAEIKTQWIEYTHGDAKLKGYLAYDDAVTGKRPAILMIHDRAGMQPYALKHAETYAKLGYVTFVADFFGYGQGILPKDVPEAVVQMGIYTKDRALMKTRAQAGYDVLVKNPMVDATKVALVGYCFGGMVGVDFGSTGVPLGAIVSIHGSFDGHPPRLGAERQGQVPDPARRRGQALSAREGRGGGLQRTPQGQRPIPDGVYSGAGHGFSVPKNKAEEVANAQSIVATDRFLKTAFAQGGGLA